MAHCSGAGYQIGASFNVAFCDNCAISTPQAVVPIMALIPPCLIALLVQDVDILVSVTGWATNSNYSILRYK